MSGYQLEVVEEEILKKFKLFISNVNSSDSFFTYYRGTRLKHIYPDVSYILENGLNKFFIVGDKELILLKINLGIVKIKYSQNNLVMRSTYWMKLKQKLNIDEFFLPQIKRWGLRLLQAICS